MKTIVTGATGGMGSAAVEALASSGKAVIMACRNLSKAEKLRAEILSKYQGAELEIRVLDLSSLASVTEFAAAIEPGSIEALFNNAGTMSQRFSLTQEGLERTFCTNYYAPWLLTNLLIPKMPAGARIVNMVSLSASWVRLDESTLHPTERNFSQIFTYARSKRALISFTAELARRNPCLHVNMADPGIVATDIIDMGHWYDALTDAVFKPLIHTPQQGVAPALRALEAEDSGKYYVGKQNREPAGRFRTADLDARVWVETEKVLNALPLTALRACR